MKKFLVGVGNVYAFNTTTGELVFTSKTMSKTDVDVKTSNTDINGGYANTLQYVYFHTPDLSITLTDTQWNLGMVAANLGSDVTVGGNVFSSETVVLGTGGTGTVVGTPLQPYLTNDTIYGWVTLPDGSTQKVTFSGKNFTVDGGSTGDNVCVNYYNQNASANIVEIPASIIPSTVRLVIETELASSSSNSITNSSIIGRVQFEIASAQISGAQTLSMSSNGVSNTPITARALAAENAVGGCSGSGVYGRIIEIIDNADPYATVKALFIEGGDFTVNVAGTKQLSVYAVNASNYVFPVNDTSKLTFSSDAASTATISATGLVTGVAKGSTGIKATLKTNTKIKAQVGVTVA